MGGAGVTSTEPYSTLISVSANMSQSTPSGTHLSFSLLKNLSPPEGRCLIQYTGCFTLMISHRALHLGLKVTGMSGLSSTTASPKLRGPANFFCSCLFSFISRSVARAARAPRHVRSNDAILSSWSTSRSLGRFVTIVLGMRGRRPYKA